MKFGIHAGLWMKAWTDDPAPIFKTASEIGFDGVESVSYTHLTLPTKRIV